MSWLRRLLRLTEHPRRSTHVERGKHPFEGIHRAGRPKIDIGVGTETRPLILPQPGKDYPGVQQSWAELVKGFKAQDLHNENQAEGIDDRSH
jgi:hypothetical protein